MSRATFLTIATLFVRPCAFFDANNHTSGSWSAITKPGCTPDTMRISREVPYKSFKNYTTFVIKKVSMRIQPCKYPFTSLMRTAELAILLPAATQHLQISMIGHHHHPFGSFPSIAGTMDLSPLLKSTAKILENGHGSTLSRHNGTTRAFPLSLIHRL